MHSIQHRLDAKLFPCICAKKNLSSPVLRLLFMYPSAVAVEKYHIHNYATICRHSVKKGKQKSLPLQNSTQFGQ